MQLRAMELFFPSYRAANLQKRDHDQNCVKQGGNDAFFYCSDGNSGFVGCCDTSKVQNPCEDGCGSYGSPIAIDLQNVPSVSYYYCKEDRHQVWQCYASEPSFFGCCESDPCKQGNQCPNKDFGDMLLRPEYRDDPVSVVTAETIQISDDVSTEDSTVKTSQAPTSASSRTRDESSEAEKLTETAMPSRSVISTVTYTPEADSTSYSTSSLSVPPRPLTGSKIAGITIGGLTALGLLVALIALLLRKYRRKQELSKKNNVITALAEKPDPPKDHGELLPQHPTPTDVKNGPTPNYTTIGQPLGSNAPSLDNKGGSRPTTGAQAASSFQLQGYAEGVGVGGGTSHNQNQNHYSMVSELGGSENPPTPRGPEFENRYTSFPGTLNIGQAPVEAPGPEQARRNAVWQLPEM